MCDGSARMFADTIDLQICRSLFTSEGNEILNSADF